MCSITTITRKCFIGLPSLRACILLSRLGTVSPLINQWLHSGFMATQFKYAHSHTCTQLSAELAGLMMFNLPLFTASLVLVKLVALMILIITSQQPLMVSRDVCFNSL